MKQKDYFLIGVIGFVSAIFSYFLSGVFFNQPESRSTEVEVVREITSDMPTPDKAYFNENAINPTKLIQIGDSSNNQTPFNEAQQ